MTPAAIEVENLGKRYRLGQGVQKEGYQKFSDALLNAAFAPFRRSRNEKSATPGDEEFWALKGVSFQIKPGEVVGVIGPNGAGKSTLLKLLSRITEPSEGRVTLHGRVASLLEVGTGFHPELTGRENIFLNGAILGMKRQEIHDSFDEIVTFAGVEKFLDTPVKRYSSGMYVRLAFSVAAHLQPEILLVDEVLAVGDAQFQQKCLGKLQDVSQNEGRTVLFVSHNMEAMLRLCSRGLLLKAGHLAMDDSMVKVAQEYQTTFAESRAHTQCTDLPRSPHLRTQALVTEIELKTHLGGVPFGSPLEINLAWTTQSPIETLHFAWAVFTAGGEEIASARLDLPPNQKNGKIQIPHLRLAPGRYAMNVGLKSERGDEDFLSRILVFDVLANAHSAQAGADSIRAHTVPATEWIGEATW